MRGGPENDFDELGSSSESEATATLTFEQGSDNYIVMDKLIGIRATYYGSPDQLKRISLSRIQEWVYRANGWDDSKIQSVLDNFVSQGFLLRYEIGDNGSKEVRYEITKTGAQTIGFS